MTSEVGSTADLVAPAGEELMARLRAGNVEALGALYDRYCDRAYRVAGSACRDDGRAEDAVQEAFDSIWHGRETYPPHRGTLAAWLLTLVSRHAIEVARRDGTHAARRTSHMHDLLARLPDAQREVITLAVYGELTHNEIAEQLGLPPGTVKGRMRLGLHRLREDIEPTGTE